MAKRKKARKSGRSRTSWAGCGCGGGAKKVSTKGRGRGWVCVTKRTVRSKQGGSVTVPRFVPAVCYGRR